MPGADLDRLKTVLRLRIIPKPALKESQESVILVVSGVPGPLSGYFRKRIIFNP